MFIFTATTIVVPLVIAYFSNIPALRLMCMFASGFVMLTVGIQYNYNMIVRCSELEKEGFTYTKPSKSKQYSKSYSQSSQNSKNKAIRQYAPKVVENEDYNELVKKLKYCMKNRLLEREDVLNFKNEVAESLGTHNKDYSKFKFENDMHEIYVKLKNKHLNSENYVNLNKSIDNLVKS